MKKLFLLGLLACAFAGNPEQADAKSSNVLNFQGTIKDAQDQVVDKNMSMTFKIYNTPTGGAALWTESNVVAVKQGFFNVYLGQTQDLDINFADELYLEITLDNGDVLPRTRVSASPFSFRSGVASFADTADVAKSVIDGVIKWENFTDQARIAGGALSGTYPNPELNYTQLVDGLPKFGIPGDKIAPGSYLHIQTSPAGPALGDVEGSNFPNLYLHDDVIDTKHLKKGAVTVDNIGGTTPADSNKVLVVGTDGIPKWGPVPSPLEKLGYGTTDGQMFYWDTASNSWKLSHNIAPTDGQVLKYDAVTGLYRWMDDDGFKIPYINDDANTNSDDAIRIAKTDGNPGNILDLANNTSIGQEVVKLTAVGDRAFADGVLNVDATSNANLNGPSKGIRVNQTVLQDSNLPSSAIDATNTATANHNSIHSGVNATSNLTGANGTAIGVNGTANGGDASIGVKGQATGGANFNIGVFADKDGAVADTVNAALYAGSTTDNAIYAKGNPADANYVAQVKEADGADGGRGLYAEGASVNNIGITDAGDVDNAVVVVRNASTEAAPAWATTIGAEGKTAIKTYGDIWANGGVGGNVLVAKNSAIIGDPAGEHTTITPPAAAGDPLTFSTGIQAPSMATQDLTVGTPTDPGQATINGDLTVTGLTNFNNMHLSGNLAVDGNTTLGTDAADILTVNATTSFMAPMTATDITANNITANTSLKSNGTLSATGNTTLGANLSVAGNETVGGTLGVTGATTLGNTLTVAGATTLNGATTINNTLGVTGNTTLGADLSVAGDETIAGNSSIGGDQTVAGNSDITGDQSVGGTLDVTGATTLNNTLDVTGNTTLGADLAVAGNSAIAGNETIGGTLDVTGATTLDNTLTVAGATQLNNTLTVADGMATVLGGTLQVKEDATFDMNADITENLTVDGNTTLGDDIATDQVTVNAKMNINGALQVTAPATFTQPVTFQNGGTVTGGNLAPTTSGNIAASLITLNPINTQTPDPIFTVDPAINNTSHLDLYEIAKPWGTSFTDAAVQNISVDGTFMVWDEVGQKWVYDQVKNYDEVDMTNVNAVPRWDGTHLVDGQMSDDGTNIVTIGVDPASGTPKAANLVVDNTTGAEVITANGNFAVTGNETVAGDLGVTGVTTLDGDLLSNANTTLGDDATDAITVNGKTTFQPTAEVEMKSDLVTIGEDNTDQLIVNSTVTFNSAISFTDLTVTGTLDAQGDVNLGSDAADIITVNGTSNFIAPATFTDLTADNITATTTLVSNGTLEVTGTSTLNDDLTVNGDTQLNGELNTTGATQLGSTLNVIGATTLQETLTVADTKATILGGTLTVKEKAFLQDDLQVDGASNVNGNSNVGGALTVTGATTLNSTLDVAGATGLASTLDVTGATTLASTLDVTGATALASTLDVAGATALASTLDVTGATTLNSTLDVTDATTLGNTLDVTGNTTLGADLSVAGNSAITGNETVGGTLDVTGNTTLGNTLDVTGNTTLGADLSVAGNSAITGNETIGGTLGVTGATTLGSTLEVTDATTLNGATAINNTLDVTGNTTLGADLTVTGITNLNGSSNIGDAAADVVTVNGTTTFNAPVTVADGQATTLNGNVTLGNTSADVIEVNGTTNFDAAITVNSTATFAGVSTFAHPINLQNGGDVSGGILKPTTGSIAANNVTIDPALVQAADPVYALNATLQNSTHVDLYEIAKPFGNTFTNTLPAATTDGVVMVWDEVGSKWVYDEASALIGGGINMTNTNAVPRWDGADLVDGQMSDDGANIVTIGVDATGVAKTANLVVDNTTGAEVITATGNLDVTGDETIGGTLDVTGITTLAGDLTANGNTTLGDAASDLIQVSGTATFAEPISGNIAGGTANQVYVTDGTNGNWVDAAPLATNLAGATVHGIAYQSAADVTAFTAAGTTGQILSVNGSGVPTWLAAPISANQVLIAGAAGNPPHWVNAAPLATNVAAGAALQIPYQTAANTTGFVTAPTTANQVLSYDGTNLVWANPVTTLAASYSATPADNTITTDATGGNVVIAGTEALEVTATGGIVGNLTGNVTGDLTGNVTGNVTGDLTGNVTGNVTGDVTGDLTGNVTGDLTGNVTGNVTGDLTGNVTGDVTGDLTGDVTGNILGGTANQVYVSDGTNGTWANAAPLATYLAGGTANGIAYQSATDVTAFTAAGTAGQVLTAGTGGVPAWSNLPVATGGTGATGAEAYPANPVIGQLFFYTDTGTTTVKIYVYSAASTWTMVAEI